MILAQLWNNENNLALTLFILGCTIIIMGLITTLWQLIKYKNKYRDSQEARARLRQTNDALTLQNDRLQSQLNAPTRAVPRDPTLIDALHDQNADDLDVESTQLEAGYTAPSWIIREIQRSVASSWERKTCVGNQRVFFRLIKKNDQLTVHIELDAFGDITLKIFDSYDTARYEPEEGDERWVSVFTNDNGGNQRHLFQEILKIEQAYYLAVAKKTFMGINTSASSEAKFDVKTGSSFRSSGSSGGSSSLPGSSSSPSPPSSTAASPATSNNAVTPRKVITPV